MWCLVIQHKNFVLHQGFFCGTVRYFLPLLYVALRIIVSGSISRLTVQWLVDFSTKGAFGVNFQEISSGNCEWCQVDLQTLFKSSCFLVSLLKRLQTVFVFYDEVGEGQSELICSIVRIPQMPKQQKMPRRVQGSLVAHIIQDKRGLVTKHKTIFWHSHFISVGWYAGCDFS